MPTDVCDKCESVCGWLDVYNYGEGKAPAGENYKLMITGLDWTGDWSSLISHFRWLNYAEIKLIHKEKKSQ